VWSWHPNAGAKFDWSRASPTGQRCAIIQGMTGAQPVPGESALYAVKTIAWGMPDVSGASAVNTRAHTKNYPARTRLRVHWAPGIPRALYLKKGDNVWKTLGRPTPRSANACLEWRRATPHSQLSSSATGSRECAPDDRLQRTIQYSRDVSDRTDRPRRTGCPAFAEHDGGGVGRKRRSLPPLFRDGPKDQTSDAQLRIGESPDSGFDAEPVIGPRFARTGGIAPE